MIKVQGLSKRYPGEERNVLSGVCFQIDAGEFVAVMGHSGSGKTTILNILGGLDTVYEGEVSVADQKLHSLSDRSLSRYRNETIGFVFQNFLLLDHLTVLENIELPSHFAEGRWREGDRRRRAIDCLEAVGLEQKGMHSPALLSGGERQRVAIARALFNQPKLLLCDEPTGALDTQTGESILALFRKLNLNEKITIVMVTHDTAVSNVADRTIRVEDGVVSGKGEA